MKDSNQITVDQFKTTLFFWEIVITIIVFTAAYFVLKGYKKKESASRAKNKKYSTGSEEEN